MLGTFILLKLAAKIGESRVTHNLLFISFVDFRARTAICATWEVLSGLPSVLTQRADRFWGTAADYPECGKVFYELISTYDVLSLSAIGDATSILMKKGIQEIRSN
jgi:hypothetical protein